jgi:lipoate---protein ligase
MLRFIKRPETDPYYNLAAEEYFLKAARADTFMTWCNAPSVIIGKHQNALKEINPQFTEKHNLPVIRRISGGGTVYHDAGNLNYSFIFTNRTLNLIDFKEFTAPIILFLQSLGLEAFFEGKNNITVNGLKVSGNSAHLYKNKVLFHGTLLYNSDLAMLKQAIKGRESFFKDKAVRSVRAEVANISDLLAEKLPTREFVKLFQDFIFNYFEGMVEQQLSESEKNEIARLSDEKYRSYVWNFGYSPEYEFNERWVFNDDEFSVCLSVKEGIIQQVELTGPSAFSGLLKELETNLKGCFHDRISVDKIFTQLAPADKIEIRVVNQLADHLF